MSADEADDEANETIDFLGSGGDDEPGSKIKGSGGDDEPNVSESGSKIKKWIVNHPVTLCIFIFVLIAVIVGLVIYIIYYCHSNCHDVYPYSLNPTKAAALPGVYIMNKAYNVLSGKELYSQKGEDVISYQWSGLLTERLHGIQYEMPIEWSGTPKIVPSCAVNTQVNDVYYTTSTSVLTEQSAASSEGWSVSVELSAGFNVGGIEAGLKIPITAGVMKGHSDTSKSAEKHSSSGYSWSFSLNTLVTLYKATINWNAKNKKFLWNSEFKDAVNNINNNPTNKTILSFFNDWGTHTLASMQTGAYCKKIAYVSSTATANQVYEFQQHVASTSENVAFWAWSSNSNSVDNSVDTFSNKIDYTFSKVYCKGEVQSTSVCGGLTGDETNPAVTSYILQPIWEINDVKGWLSDESLNNLNSFIQYLFDSLVSCSKQYCNSNGICTINENIWNKIFINNEWDGIDFSALWNIIENDNDNTYCFCNDGWYGKHCTSATNCQCEGDSGCCCYEQNSTCDSQLLCDPKQSLCINSNSASVICGNYGGFLKCDSGVITSVCGSGGNADCGAFSGECPKESYTGIVCNYPQLGGYITSIHWSCTDYGKDIDCTNKVNGGDLMIGLCGSGGNPDCSNESCHGYVGILCGSIDDVSVNQQDCKWKEQKDWGIFMRCDDGYIATGYCGSGSQADCDGNVFKIKCCRLNYPHNTTMTFK